MLLTRQIKNTIINLEYYALILVVLIVRLMPFYMMVFFFRSVGWLLSYFFPKEKRISVVQLMFVARQLKKRNIQDSTQGPIRKFKLTPNLSEKEAVKIFRASFSHAAQLIYETLIIKRLLKKVVEVSDDVEKVHYPHIIYDHTDFFDDMNNPDIPMMSLASHAGCFELLAAYSISNGNKRVSIIGRAPDNPVFARIIRDAREGYGGTMIFRDDPHSAAKLLRAIKNNEHIGVLIDHDVALKHQFSPFFDLKAAYPEAPLRLATRYGLSIYSTIIVRETASKHKIFTEKILYDKDDSEAISKILARYSKNLEEILCSYPEQWFWWHRRWRRRPGVPYDQKTVWPPTTEEYLKWIESL